MTEPRTVALAVLDGMPAFELAIACQVFDRPPYDLRLCAVEPELATNARALRAFATHRLDALTTAHTVIVPALPYDHPLERPEVDGRLISALQAAHTAGARIVSLCTGAFALAQAGLLDGRRATTHWLYTDVLAERHPLIDVDPAVLYVDDGDVLTSAGRTAGLDLCLHLIRKDLGAKAGNDLARMMVAPPHRTGGQAQYISAPMPPDDDPGLAPLLQWATTRLHHRLTIADLAREAGLSPRSLIRRFHDHLGTTPLRWLHDQRLTRARELLETTTLPIDRVAEHCGMGSPANFRHHFIRTTGVPPTAYRRTFQSSR